MTIIIECKITTGINKKYNNNTLVKEIKKRIQPYSEIQTTQINVYCDKRFASKKIYDAFWYLVSYWMADTYAQYIIVETKMVLGKPLVQSTQIFRSCPLGAGGDYRLYFLF